jgi:predicted AlkP superfamily pyrophosphatase or phosphodiesterase
MAEQLTLNDICLTHVAATITQLLGIEAPEQATDPLETVLQVAKRFFHGHKADRVLIYNPDALALWLFQKYTRLYDAVLRKTQIGLPMLSVMPSVTPVCFASMYTGTMPEIHGIRKYEKPVVRTDTLFDALIRSGKKPVIIASTDSSMSKIFLERKMDYYIYDTAEACNEKTLALIEKDEHDLILVYNGNYDAAMHRNAPEGTEAMAALKENVAAFETLTTATEKAWIRHNTVVCWLTDHGCHEIDGQLGSHGLDMPEDMNVMHFYGFQPAAPDYSIGLS